MTPRRSLCHAALWLAMLPAGCAPHARTEVDTVRRVALRAPEGESIGIVISAAACGETLYVADARGDVWRVDTRPNAQTADRLALVGEADVQAIYAVAVECQTDSLYVLDPMTRRIVEVDRHTAVYRRHWSLPVEAERFTMPAGRLAVLPGPTIAVAGVTFGASGGQTERPTASYYRGLKLVLLLEIATGRWRTAVDAFDESCAAACAETSVAASSTAVVVTQPATPRVGLYDDGLRLRRVVDVSSPGLLRQPPQPAASLPQQAAILWGRSNSSVRAAWATEDHLHTVHSLNAVDDDWAPGRALVQWRQFLNVHTLEGRPVALDQPLAGYYIGHTRAYVVSADYGSGERQRSAPAVDIVLTRVAVD